MQERTQACGPSPCIWKTDLPEYYFRVRPARKSAREQAKLRGQSSCTAVLLSSTSCRLSGAKPMSESTSRAFPYLPHTDADRQAMLKSVGVRAFEELIEQIPKEVRAKDLEIPSGLSELELKEYVASLAAKNKPASKQKCFLGGGSYRRFVPAAVSAIVGRSEFATAYTPYQPEVSQGSLQAIYEFQTAVCLLTGMEVANASM